MSVSIKRSQFQRPHLSHKPSFSTWKARGINSDKDGNSRGWQLTKILYFQKTVARIVLAKNNAVCVGARVCMQVFFHFRITVNNSDVNSK